MSTLTIGRGPVAHFGPGAVLELPEVVGDFAVPALPIVAVPTTAGTGAETNAFGVVTDPAPRCASASA
jgi:alcohol dehydrogenase class IV